MSIDLTQTVPLVAPPPPPPPPPRRPWRAVVVTAVVTGVVAVAGTVAVQAALDDRPDDAGPAQEQAAPEERAPETAPPVTADGTAPDWQAVAEAVRPSVVAIAVRGPAGGSEGSGVVLDTDGRIITNDHVVAGGGRIMVTLVDGRVYEAEVVGTDPTTDVAVIALTDPPDDLVAAAFGDSDEVAVGEPVMAVGNPLGLDSTATTGIVSAVDRPVSTGSPGRGEPVVTNAIQVDAAINPGNSGGPLFDASGRVVGITSSILTTSRSSGSIGLGFAIPANLALRVATELVEDGAAAHAFLGVRLADGTARTADGTVRLGAVVVEATAGGPAADAGLRTDDVVVAIDDEPVSGAESLTAQVRERTPGDEVTLTVVRGGETRTVDVVLGSREEGRA
ncbi:MAG: PDZ domain-containing protein [Actinomycetales bacterium]|jgi:putative serine protease PepD|nr:PDZ domain-containing protein [Actinomycetales bacterium]